MPANIHATALVLGDRGLLVTGPSGSGKTTLALALLRAYAASGRFAAMVADDRVLVQAGGRRLIARCPETIAGLAEVYGVGPRPVNVVNCAVIDLCLRLAAAAPRFQEPSREVIEGVAVPALDLTARNVEAAGLAVASWLKTAPFR